MTATQHGRKERPIIFSGPMIRAIREGRKTQTRRPVKPQPSGRGDYWDLYNGGPEWALWLNDNRMSEPRTWRCPYGAPGDLLWTRERHAIETGHASDDYPKIHYAADMAEHDHDGRSVCPTSNGPSLYAGKWRPSIHMPRWASRDSLEVVGVRVERVQDISEEDAVAEGFDCREQFAQAWVDIYGAESWGRNEWVWVVEFRRVT